jgi:hypothetical protein
MPPSELDHRLATTLLCCSQVVASREVSFPSTHQAWRPPCAGVCLAPADPPSGFLTLLMVFAPPRPRTLFHVPGALGILPFRGFPSTIAGDISRCPVPSCRWLRTPTRVRCALRETEPVANGLCRQCDRHHRWFVRCSTSGSCSIVESVRPRRTVKHVARADPLLGFWPLQGSSPQPCRAVSGAAPALTFFGARSQVSEDI